MNKIVLICSVLLMVIFFNLAWSFRARTVGIIEKKQALFEQTSVLKRELKEKLRLSKKVPMGLSEAFTDVVNEMNAMSNYSGLSMAFVFPPAQGRSNIEKLYKSTAFRGVKGLPLDIKVLKVGAMADVGSAMDSIFLLEAQTDLKLTEIYQDSKEIRAKGMLYGI